MRNASLIEETITYDGRCDPETVVVMVTSLGNMRSDSQSDSRQQTFVCTCGVCKNFRLNK